MVIGMTTLSSQVKKLKLFMDIWQLLLSISMCVYFWSSFNETTKILFVSMFSFFFSIFFFLCKNFWMKKNSKCIRHFNNFSLLSLNHSSNHPINQPSNRPNVYFNNYTIFPFRACVVCECVLVCLYCAAFYVYCIF